jgi:hypothetical protein
MEPPSLFEKLPADLIDALILPMYLAANTEEEIKEAKELQRIAEERTLQPAVMHAAFNKTKYLASMLRSEDQEREAARLEEGKMDKEELKRWFGFLEDDYEDPRPEPVRRAQRHAEYKKLGLPSGKSLRIAAHIRKRKPPKRR